jgi:hypothetical protein
VESNHLSATATALQAAELAGAQRPRERMEGGLGSPQPETETSPSDGLRSQLLPIGASASACPRRHLLTGRPWRLVEASCTLGPALCTSPCSVTSSAHPSEGRSSSLRGWDSNPRSRAHEARGDNRSPTARSGWLESNQRSPVPETGGVARLPHSQVESTTVESNHAPPPHQSGACPAGPSSDLLPRMARPRSQVVNAGRYRSHALARTLRSSCGRDSGRLQEGFRLAHKDGASPGNRTLLVGVTARGLATSLATQSRREESNPRPPR